MLRASNGAVVAGLVLAGCGGGGGGDSTRIEPAYNNYLVAGDTLASEIAAIPYTDPGSLPDSGTYTYNGVAGAILSDNSRLLGQLRLEANFRDDVLTGDVSDVYDEDENAFSGILTISNSMIDRTADVTTDFTYDADLDGTLRDTEGNAYVVDAEMIGDFTGANAEYVEGYIEGTVQATDGTLIISDGVFVGER